MTTKAIKEQAKSLKKHIVKTTASKKAAMVFLASTGVYTEKGNLTKHFK